MIHVDELVVELLCIMLQKAAEFTSFECLSLVRTIRDTGQFVVKIVHNVVVNIFWLAVHVAQSHAI